MEQFPLIYDAKHRKAGSSCKSLFLQTLFPQDRCKIHGAASPGLGFVYKKKKIFYNLQEFFPILVINNPKMAFAFL